MRYVTGIDEQGKPIDVKDPHACGCAALPMRQGAMPGELADGLLAVARDVRRRPPGQYDLPRRRHRCAGVDLRRRRAGRGGQGQ